MPEWLGIRLSESFATAKHRIDSTRVSEWLG
jgi:hypothetical protein